MQSLHLEESYILCLTWRIWFAITRKKKICNKGQGRCIVFCRPSFFRITLVIYVTQAIRWKPRETFITGRMSLDDLEYIIKILNKIIVRICRCVVYLIVVRIMRTFFFFSYALKLLYNTVKHECNHVYISVCFWIVHTGKTPDGD